MADDLFGNDESAKKERWSDKDLTPIYDAYPRKVARAAALRAIRRALYCIVQKLRVQKNESDPLAWLLARVQKYAKSSAGNAGQYTPHPATWFNQGRYDDDEREWNHGASVTPPPPPSFASKDGVRTKVL